MRPDPLVDIDDVNSAVRVVDPCVLDPAIGHGTRPNLTFVSKFVMDHCHKPSGSALAVMKNMIATVVPGLLHIPSCLLYTAKLYRVFSQPVLQDVPVIGCKAACVPRKKLAMLGRSMLAGSLTFLGRCLRLRRVTGNILTAESCRREPLASIPSVSRL